MGTPAIRHIRVKIIIAIENNETAGHVARMGERICEYRALVGKPAGKKRLGRPRSR